MSRPEDVLENAADWVVNEYTGEIFERGDFEKEIRYSQPIELDKIVSREVYDGIVADKTSRKRYKLWVSGFVLDIVAEKVLSGKALCLLCVLGREIGYNNMVYCTLAEMILKTGYVRQTVGEALAELKNLGFVKEVKNKFKGRDDRLFLINPLYFFLGYYPHKDKLVKDWYSSK
jgi:DNA-binding transcriptional ArsR family regulator